MILKLENLSLNENNVQVIYNRKNNIPLYICILVFCRSEIHDGTEGVRSGS